MRVEHLNAGSWYVVAGKGPMRLKETYHSMGREPVCCLETPQGEIHHATAFDITSLLTCGYLDAYEDDLVARGLDVSWVPAVRKALP